MMPTLVDQSRLAAGTWAVDPSHSEVSFVVRHLGVFKVCGSFASFQASIDMAADPTECVVTACVDTASVDTREPNRDAHLRSPDFFDVEKYPQMTFRSTEIRVDGEQATMVGDLTIKDTTCPVELTVECTGVVQDPMGQTRGGFVATGEVKRSDFGITFNMPFGESGVVISDKVRLQMEIQAVLQKDEPAGESQG